METGKITAKTTPIRKTIGRPHKSGPLHLQSPGTCRRPLSSAKHSIHESRSLRSTTAPTPTHTLPPSTAHHQHPTPTMANGYATCPPFPPSPADRNPLTPLPRNPQLERDHRPHNRDPRLARHMVPSAQGREQNVRSPFPSPSSQNPVTGLRPAWRESTYIDDINCGSAERGEVPMRGKERRGGER